MYIIMIMVMKVALHPQTIPLYSNTHEDECIPLLVLLYFLLTVITSLLSFLGLLLTLLSIFYLKPSSCYKDVAGKTLNTALLKIQIHHLHVQPQALYLN